jgi:hypothetical protein
MNNVLAWQIDVCVKHRGNENGGKRKKVVWFLQQQQQKEAK